jgi:hypothetical protein
MSINNIGHEHHHKMNSNEYPIIDLLLLLLAKLTCAIVKI